MQVTVPNTEPKTEPLFQGNSPNHFQNLWTPLKTITFAHNKFSPKSREISIMKTSLITFSCVFTALTFFSINANAQNIQSNPLMGTWLFVSCAPIEKNPCADHTTPTSRFSKLIFKSKHMEFADGDVLPIRYIIEDGEVIVDSDGTFNSEKFTFPDSKNEATLNFRNIISGKAIIKYKRP